MAAMRILFNYMTIVKFHLQRTQLVSVLPPTSAEGSLQCWSFKWYMWMFLNMYSGKGNLKQESQWRSSVGEVSHVLQKHLLETEGLFLFFPSFFPQGEKQHVLFLQPIFFFFCVCDMFVSFIFTLFLLK